MNIEIYYAAINVSVLPAWTLLIFAPKWAWTDKLIHRVWIPGILCIGYALILFLKPSPPEGSGIGTLSQFMTMMSGPYSALQIWIQLVAWDLFIGAWVSRDAIRHNIPHGFVVPCLLGTFIFPPLGLLAYFIIRYGIVRSTTLQEA